MSAIRFSDLVKTSGNPEPKSLWTDPKKDGGFMRAVKQNRVITLVQIPSSKKKDFGEIGFHQQPHAAYFVFPKPLPTDRGKVIGIKYDLMGEAKPGDVISPKDLKRQSVPEHKNSPRKEKPEPPRETFNVWVRRIAAIEMNIQVAARNKTEAKKQAEDMLNGRAFDISKAKIQNQIKFVK